ncbi:MAG: diguanylate cyclase domain-containing protein [Methylophilaceae bacterium]
MLLGVFVGAFFIHLALQEKDAEMRQQLVQQVQTINFVLSWSDMYASIKTNSSLANSASAEAKLALEVLHQYRERMADICAVYPGCNAIYLMSKNSNNQIIFLLDSEEGNGELLVKPGTVYDEASEISYAVFDSKKPMLDGLDEDRWGVWMSALIPHALADGSVVVLGIDVDAKDWDSIKWGAALAPIYATLAYMGLMLFFVGLWRSKTKQNQLLQESEAKLLKLSHEDSLTGLVNRRFFDERLQQMMAEFDRSNVNFALLYLDLDKFKQVNDTLGHQAGDDLLQSVARKLLAILRLEDTVARLSGDEFAILLPRTNQQEGAHLVAQKIVQEINKPITLNNQSTLVSASIGIAICSTKLSGADKLLRAADAALYAAKNKGGNCYYFADEVIPSS